jgi:ABC-type bacteriocin/lantibiotic exporter with double-glycine peptidase domain
MKILLKRKRTVLLATDRLDFIEKASKIVFLKDGKIEAQVNFEFNKYLGEKKIVQYLTKEQNRASSHGLVQGFSNWGSRPFLGSPNVS